MGNDKFSLKRAAFNQSKVVLVNVAAIIVAKMSPFSNKCEQASKTSEINLIRRYCHGSKEDFNKFYLLIHL